MRYSKREASPTTARFATKLIKLADKISNVRSVAASPPVDSNRRRREYIQFCAAVVNQLRGTLALLEAEFDPARELAAIRVAD